MTQTSTRPFARFGTIVLSALVVAALWLPTLTVPPFQAAGAPVATAVELA